MVLEERNWQSFKCGNCLALAPELVLAKSLEESFWE